MDADTRFIGRMWTSAGVKSESSSTDGCNHIYFGKQFDRLSTAQMLLMCLWEAGSIIVAGFLCASFAHSVLNLSPSGHGDNSMALAMIHFSLPSGLLAPVIIRMPHLLKNGDTARWFPLTGMGQAKHVLTLSAAALCISIVLSISGVQSGLRLYWVAWWIVLMTVFCVIGYPFVTGSRRRRWAPERVVVVGSPEIEGGVVERVLTERGPVEMISHFPDPLDAESPLSGRDFSDVLALGRATAIDCILLASSADDAWVKHAVQILKNLDARIVRCAINPSSLASDGQIDVVTLVDRPLGQFGVILKLLEDWVLGFILFVCLLPLFALIAIAIKLDSAGPVFFRQYRKGRNNTVFRIFKFRTMQWQDETSSNGAKQTERRDRRVTRVGRFLRRSSLDEIPQLLNVLCGQMSLVGPRPLPVAMLTEGRLNEELMDNYGHRHRVKPGLTGLAQINGYRGAVSKLEDLRKRVDCDLFYIERWSILLDLQILARTPTSLIFSKDNAF